MTHVPSARRFRPQQFKNVLGQNVATTILQNAIRYSRVANLYLLIGPKGCGKTTLARLVAKALNCPVAQDMVKRGEAPEPCDACGDCLAITRGSSELVVEVDAASHNGVDDARSFTGLADRMPPPGKVIILILDECHMLSPQAQNALLVLFENPPPSFLPILCTTNPEKILDTIKSRASQIKLKPIEYGLIEQNLRMIFDTNQQPVTDEALTIMAQYGGGSLRDVQQLADMVIAAAHGENVVIDETFLETRAGLATTGMYRNLMGSLDEAWESGILPWVEYVQQTYESGFPMDQVFFHMLPNLIRDIGVARSCIDLGVPSPVKYLSGIRHEQFLANLQFTHRDIDIMLEAWEEQAPHMGVSAASDKSLVELWFLKCWGVVRYERNTSDQVPTG